MRSVIASLKEKGILVSDGAWGTFIHKKGLKANECPESWNLSRPDDILDVAKSYANSGAHIILTNSFGGSPSKLEPYGLAEQTYEINKAAAEISRAAAGKDMLVLGSIGPTGKMLMMGDISEELMFEGFAVQVKGLIEGGADGIILETMSDIDEARVAIRAAKSVTDKEILCTFTFSLTPADEYRTMMGNSPEEIVSFLAAESVDVIGANCGNGTAGMIEIVKLMRAVDEDIPILVHANAGMPELRDGKSVFPETPNEMACQVPELISAGANIVGGCCGTTPEHIKKIITTIK